MLSPKHLCMLKEESAISDEIIEARGYRTITSKDELEELGFARSQCHVPGLLIPVIYDRRSKWAVRLSPRQPARH